MRRLCWLCGRKRRIEDMQVFSTHGSNRLYSVCSQKDSYGVKNSHEYRTICLDYVLKLGHHLQLKSYRENI